MNKFTIQTYLALIAIGFLIFSACAKEEKLEPLDVGSNPDLAAHSVEFKQEVIKVTDGVYVAVGFGLANSVLLEGDDDVVIVDAMESEEAAIPVKEAFSKITAKPVKAIIFTHYHPDHTNGATIMAGDDDPDIYAHSTTSYYMERISTITRETTTAGACVNLEPCCRRVALLMMVSVRVWSMMKARPWDCWSPPKRFRRIASIWKLRV